MKEIFVIDKKTTLAELKDMVQKFIKERDWQEFHTPKNLSMYISVEASELMELFLWCDSKDSFQTYKDKQQEVQDELADILMVILAFANATDIDITKAFESKFKKTAAKYPVEKYKGLSCK